MLVILLSGKIICWWVILLSLATSCSLGAMGYLCFFLGTTDVRPVCFVTHEDEYAFLSSSTQFLEDASE